MSTAKYKSTVSPYVSGLREVPHHESDFKYQEFKDSLPPPTGVDAASASSSSSSFSRGVVSVALFGLGRAGSLHLPNLIASPRVRLAYVVEADRERCEWVKKKWNLGGNGEKEGLSSKQTVFLQPESVSRVYSDASVDACLVATPTFTHEDIIVASLRAGKAVFSEKPIAETMEGTERCYAVAEEVGRPLFCAFNRRFEPSFEQTYHRVRRGEVGHVQVIKTISRDCPLSPKEYLSISGGIFHDCAVHDVDMVTWVLGEYPSEVFAAASAHIPEIRETGDYDTIAIMLKFPSGTLGLIDCSRYSSYGYDQRMEVFGQKGMILMDNDSPNPLLSFSREAVERTPIYHSFPSRYSTGYRRELSHFLDVAEGSSASSVCARTTAAVTKITDACERSAKSGAPVSLSWEEREMPDGYCIVKGD